MSLAAILFLAGLVLFGLSLALFRRRPNAGAMAGSMWKHGSASGRFALLFWWASLVLLSAGGVVALIGS